MSFGLSRGKALEGSPVSVDAGRIPPLPDDVLSRPGSGWVDPRGWFADPAQPLEIEIGSGKGTFLVQQAALQPGTNFLGFEYAREFFSYAADRVRRAGLPNVRMLCVDAADFLHWRVPDGCAGVIHLYFPDPWPKSRHHRRRMVQDRFLADCARILPKGGELRVVTDHDEYWAWMQEHFARWTSPSAERPAPVFERRDFASPASVGDGELVGTNFERKYRREGRPFHAAVLRRV